MRKITKNINTNINGIINIIPIFDVHIINATFDKKLYEKTVKYIETHPDTYWFGGGDFCEFINFKDKRFAPGELYPDLKVGDLADIYQKEIDMFKDMTKSILTPDKCLGLMIGNHENKIAKSGEGDIINNLCKEYNIPYLGYSGYLRLSFTRGRSNTVRKFQIYFHHGWSAPRTQGARVNNLVKMAYSHECHIAVTGHAHGRVCTGPLDYGTFNGSERKYGILCGSFKKGVDFEIETWEESRGYDQGQNQIGTYIIQVKPYPTGDEPMEFRVLEFEPDWDINE
jgi:hypothetical protein